MTTYINSRQIYINHFGFIPKDHDDRTYEIHHKDGNRQNNDISNLACLSIQEHYNIHQSQRDWGACALIAKRMKKSPKEISELCRKHGKTMVGEKNGFYGKKHSEESKRKMSEANKGRVQSKETKRKRSLSNKGKTAWNKGLKVSEETRQRLIKCAHTAAAKTWKITDSLGIEYIVHSRVKFCKEHNLNYNTLNDYSRRGKLYKGYYCCLYNKITSNP